MSFLVSQIGVTVSYVPNGVTRKAFDKVIDSYPRPGEIIRDWKKGTSGSTESFHEQNDTKEINEKVHIHISLLITGI